MEKKEEKGILNSIYNWFKNLTVKGLLGMILILFTILIILISFSLIPRALNGLSNSFSTALYSIFIPAEKATVVADKKIVESGEDFLIKFNEGDMKNGVFTISYSCEFDIELLAIESTGLNKINCDTPYYILNNTISIPLKVITNSDLVRLVIDSSFENNDTQKIEKVGVIRIIVKNNPENTTVNLTSSTTPINTNEIETQNPKSTNTPKVTINNYQGIPDLSIRILQIGLLQSGTNLISDRNQFSGNETVGIRFEVRNDGDANTGLWYFTAVLPSISTPIYNSAPQISLKPGEKIVYTLGFSNLKNEQNGLITINIDPQNFVKENIEYNNFSTSQIINLNYNNNYNSNTGCYVNGIFTYNCNYQTLSVNCFADPDDPEKGERVRWYADAFGGNGNYTYKWTGTDNLKSTSQNPTKKYTSRGSKYATVTVKSNNTEISQTCYIYVD